VSGLQFPRHCSGEVRKIDDRELTDEQLLLLTREMDTAAFTALYRRHVSAVLRYGWSILHDQLLAEEAAQETFLTAWDKRRSIRIVGESVLPWLLVACRNHSRNLLRRRQKHNTMPLPDIGDSEGGTEELSWIGEEIRSLSPADRRLCELCLIGGYSYREAAHELQITEAAVGKRLQRLRARLAESTSSEE